MANVEGNAHSGTKERLAVREIGRIRLLQARGLGGSFLPAAKLGKGEAKHERRARQMRAKEKAEAINYGLKTNLNGHSRRAFSVSDFTAKHSQAQCPNCFNLELRLALETSRADLNSFDLRQLKRRIKAVIE